MLINGNFIHNYADTATHTIAIILSRRIIVEFPNILSIERSIKAAATHELILRLTVYRKTANSARGIIQSYKIQGKQRTELTDTEVPSDTAEVNGVLWTAISTRLSSQFPRQWR